MKIGRIFSWCGVVTLMLCMLTPSVTAQTTAPQTGSGLSISPTRNELTLEPGKSEKVTITLKNVTTGDLITRAQINDFESDNETGEPKLIVDTTKQSTSSVKPFVSGLVDTSLKAGDRKDVVITVKVPDDYPPGAYYGIVRYVAVPANREQTKDTQVALTASVGSLLLITVPGSITEKIQVPKVQVMRQGVTRRFFTQAPDQVSVTIRNLGNGFSKPFGKVTINGPGGQAFSYELNATDPRSNILPNSTRIFKDAVKNIKKPGRYTVYANVSHGSGGEVLVTKTSFWYLPRWFMIAIVVLIAVLVAVIAYFVTRRGKKRR